MADAEVGYLSPSELQRVWNMVLEFERMRSAQGQEIRLTPPSPIYFRNDSGHTIPPYGCIQAYGTYDEDGGQNYLKVKRPFQWTDAVVGPFLFNGPREVANNEFGIAQSGPVFRAISDGGTYTAGTRLNPTAGVFTLSKGPLFSYIGPDDVEEDCIKVIACETPILAKAGAGGIAANSSGTVTHRIPSATTWSDGTITYTAWAPTATAVSANAQLMLFPVDAKWVAVEICP